MTMQLVASGRRGSGEVSKIKLEKEKQWLAEEITVANQEIERLKLQLDYATSSVLCRASRIALNSAKKRRRELLAKFNKVKQELK